MLARKQQWERKTVTEKQVSRATHLKEEHEEEKKEKKRRRKEGTSVIHFLSTVKMTIEVPRYTLVDNYSTECSVLQSFSYRRKSLHRRDNSNYLYYGTVNLMYSIKELLSGSKHNFCHSSNLVFHLSACIQNRCHKTRSSTKGLWDWLLLDNQLNVVFIMTESYIDRKVRGWVLSSLPCCCIFIAAC